MKYLIFFFLFVANIGIFGETSTPTVFISKNPYATTETYNTPINKSKGLMNLSITKVTPKDISGIMSGKSISFSPENLKSLEYFPITSLENLNLKNISRNNFLLKKNTDNTLSINRDSFKDKLYLLGINKNNNKLEKLYQYKEKEIIKTINLSVNTFEAAIYLYNSPPGYYNLNGFCIFDDLSQITTWNTPQITIDGNSFIDLEKFGPWIEVFIKDETSSFKNPEDLTSFFLGRDTIPHFHHYYPKFFSYENAQVAVGPHFKNNPYNESKKNLIVFAVKNWNGSEINHSYTIKQNNLSIKLNANVKPLPNNAKGTLNIYLNSDTEGSYTFDRFGNLVAGKNNIISSFSGDKYLTADYGDKVAIGDKIYSLTTTNSHHKTSDINFCTFKNSTFKISFNSNGLLIIEPTKLDDEDILFPIKIYRKDKLVGDFTIHINRIYKGNCNFEISPSKTPDCNYTFNSKGTQLTGDNNFKLTGDTFPSGLPINKFKIESVLGTKEKIIEDGKDSILEFEQYGNIFKIGFDKNKNFKIILEKVSSANLDFNFKLIGLSKDKIFEEINFSLKRKPLPHKKEQLNININSPEENLLFNNNKGILLNYEPDKDLSPDTSLKKLRFKNKEYKLTYNFKENAYITEQIEISPNFKSCFYLNYKNKTIGFKKNLQWNGQEVKDDFTYLEYNSLDEICTEHSIGLNIQKFIPKTSVIEVSIPSKLTLPFEVTIDSKGNPSNKRISINHQGQIPYLNPEDSIINCIFQGNKSSLNIKDPLFSINKDNKNYIVGYKNSQLYLKIMSINLTSALDDTIIFSQEINNTLNGKPIQRATYKIILKRKPTFISIEGDTMEFGDMIVNGGTYYGKSKIILTNAENKVIKTKVTNPNNFLINENYPEDKLPLKNINVTDVLNTSLNTSIFYIQGSVNVTNHNPGNYKGNIILELTLD